MKKIKKMCKKLGCIVLVSAMVITGGMNNANSGKAAVKISKKKVTLSVGQSYKLSIIGAKKKAKWSSAQKSVVSVTKTGKIKAKKKGKAVIKAKIGKKSYKCTVTVVSKKNNKTVTQSSNTSTNKNTSSVSDNNKTEEEVVSAYSISFKNETGGDFVSGTSNATLRFKLDNNANNVVVNIADSIGKVVYTQSYPKCNANAEYTLNWNGTGTNGAYVSEGTYKANIVVGSKKFESAGVSFYMNPFNGGDGSETNPYQISTLDQFKMIGKFNTRNFVQTADIDCNNATITSVCPKGTYFEGTYNGNKHTISNVYMHQKGDSGIFGYNKGTICDLTVDELHIKGFRVDNNASRIGGLISVNEGIISGCCIQNSEFEGDGVFVDLGGVVGWNHYGEVIGCFLKNSTIKKIEDNGYSGKAGGIVCYSEGGVITNCVCEDSNIISGEGVVGGIIGEYRSGKVSGCSFLRSTTTGYAIVGDTHCNTDELTNCFTDTEYPLWY